MVINFSFFICYFLNFHKGFLFSRCFLVWMCSVMVQAQFFVFKCFVFFELYGFFIKGFSAGSLFLYFFLLPCLLVGIFWNYSLDFFSWFICFPFLSFPFHSGDEDLKFSPLTFGILIFNTC